MQFGPDTIQIGEPFKPLDKIGVMISIRRTNTGNSLMLDCRSKDAILNSDTIDILQSYLVFVLNKNDTIKSKPVPGRYNTKFKRLQGGAYFFSGQTCQTWN